MSSAQLSTEVRAGRIARHYDHAVEDEVLETVVQGDGFTSVSSVLALDPAERKSRWRWRSCR